MDQEQKQQPKRSPLVLVLIIIIVVLAAAAVVLVVGKFGEKPEEAVIGDAQTPLIGYEEGVTVVDDPDALQKAYNEKIANPAMEGIPLEYQNGATSKDGENFTCYIANPASAEYDVFINIFSDQELTDQLYLSKLIAPGNAKRDIKLDKKLETGTHRVYVVYSQVDNDHTTLLRQAVVTMDFTVQE